MGSVDLDAVEAGLDDSSCGPREAGDQFDDLIGGQSTGLGECGP